MRDTPGHQCARFLAIAGTLLLALTLPGCANKQTKALKARDAAFEKTTEAYRKLIRWNYFEEASKYLKGRDAELPQTTLAGYENWKVTNYDVGDVMRNKAGDEARVVVHIGFYSKETGAVFSLRDEQLWWYDEAESHWWLGSPFPDFYAIARHGHPR